MSARFTLDALPGKQMSIDADMRAGIIDANEAKRRRDTLSRESQFYGSMDGAMKFVKGDAIAGICVSLVNIAAGLGIGVGQKGLDFATAAKQYTLLTVGDGLVSQLPSLVIATTAGIITTRVASGRDEGEEGTSLGEEIGAQILAQPKALGVAATTFGLLGLVPGLPTLPFLVLSGAGWCLVLSLRKAQREEEQQAVHASLAEESVASEEQRRLPVSQPVILETSPQITPLVDVGRDPRFVQELIPEMREWMFQDMGVYFPGVKVRGDAGYLDDHGYVIYVNEVPTATGSAWPDRLYAADSARLAPLGVEGVMAPHPSGGPAGMWIQPMAGERARQAGVQVMTAEEYMAVHLAHVLKANVDQLLGIQDVQNMLDLLEQQGYETLVGTVVPKLLTVQRLTDVLKRLLQDDISIKNMRRILEALAHWAPFENDPVYLTEYVRMGLKEYIAYKVSGGRSMLPAWVLDPAIEQAIESGIRQSASGSSLSLDPETSRSILDGFKAALGPARVAQLSNPQAANSPHAAIVLTQMEVRHFLQRLLHHELPGVKVSLVPRAPFDTADPADRSYRAGDAGAESVTQGVLAHSSVTGLLATRTSGREGAGTHGDGELRGLPEPGLSVADDASGPVDCWVRRPRAAWCPDPGVEALAVSGEGTR